ncbi:bifunctional precorrin-2 dehydrogenase/sirohydrochlorin ferrochelatase [Lutibacter sp. HS1-25]|uniref:precorrin-2 dehydrogenase/sirohydrochlorin ferrochelatase family protein n=1 Tax=Lutibacter sp. HS1-25 TaxID=2485000 RepID=UPI001010A934|nr:bifunctional precorrin-2 dehydrogenase/sirohydrochlorin ferrochelatase [Lutibacter sp. HS1-25]RXP55486.1 bifunctional precorrin-2 dehydrogenase/sirohydrochlorin ferrochelatase [Lutibacter sp. HS1-25]
MSQNELYPVFLKVSQLNVLIVGGGNVGLEKLTFLLKSSPNAKVTIVSINFHPDLVALAKKHDVMLVESSYNPSFLDCKHMVVATTDNIDVNVQVYHDCKSKSILVNVADNPPYCDFYMGGIVTKGNIKIAISTNGKSPTLAKRLRQFFEEVIPENIDELAENLNAFRKTIKGDFQQKVDSLNELTKGIVHKKE